MILILFLLSGVIGVAAVLYSSYVVHRVHDASLENSDSAALDYWIRRVRVVERAIYVSAGAFFGLGVYIITTAT